MSRYKSYVFAGIPVITGLAFYAIATRTFNTAKDASSLQPQVIAPAVNAKVVSQNQSGSSDSKLSDSENLLRTHGYPKEVPLSQAVNECNRRIQNTRVGKTQPPLTVDEVLAAIRDWSNKEAPIDPKMYNVIQNISKTEIMPKGSYFFFSTGTISYNGYDIDALRIYLRVGLDKYPDDLVGVPVYSRQIRSQYISSRPTKLP
jgi:hypothetical protein